MDFRSLKFVNIIDSHVTFRQQNWTKIWIQIHFFSQKHNALKFI